MVYISFLLKISSKLAISHLFWRFHTFFTHLFQFFLHHIIRLLNCYKNIYGLHRFYIENSSKLAISHLFWRFNTFFQHLFRNFFSLCTTPHSYQSIKKKIRSIPTTVLKFWVGTRFCDTDKRRTNDERTNDERQRRRRLGSQYPEWTKSLRLKRPGQKSH